jgi:glycosyltransferase involved in cell wall biosynthesis
VAEWRRHKRLNETIEIIHRLNALDKKYCLVVVGEAVNIPVSDYIFPVGRIDNSELYKYYQCCDVCLHLCWIDNCPNTVVEAIANNIPVICSNQGGTRELVEVAEAGIVSECDKDIEFVSVDLNRPPTPEIEKIIKDILNLFSNYEKYKKKIKREVVDIELIARKYADFLQEIWTAITLERKNEC